MRRRSPPARLRQPPQRLLVVERSAAPVTPVVTSAPEPDSDPTKRMVEKLLALASLTYGLGFVTVFVHTGRLGLPVLALLEPVYILVGLPLTLTGLLSQWLWRWLSREMADNTRRIRQAMQQYRSPEALLAQDVFSEFWNLYASLMGVVSFILPFNLEWMMKLLLRPYQQQVEELLRKDLQAQQLMWKWLKQINAVIQGIRHVARLLGVILIPLLILFVVMFYIFWLYPHIPQSWGGGSVRQVELLMEAEKIPPMLLSKADAAVPKSEKNRLVAVKLLYKTDDFYFVEANNGARLALAKEQVNGVVWVPLSRP